MDDESRIPHMETDLRAELDRSFGDGPVLGDTATLLAHGRAALRRRRIAELTSTLAVVAIVLVAAAVAGGGSEHTAPPVGRPTGAATATPSAGSTSTRAVDPRPTGAPRPLFPPPKGSAPVRDSGLPMDWAVAAQRDGLHVSPEVTVLEVVDDPWHYRSQGAWSVALSYRDGHGVVTWWAGYVNKGGGGTSAQIERRYAAGMDFDAWVQAQDNGLDYAEGRTESPDGAADWPGRVRMDLVGFVAGTERLIPREDVTLVRQRAHPDLPDSWAGDGDRSAVAEVRSEGVRYYVLARADAGGPPQYVAVRASRGGATLDDFLDLARQRYAEGGGGLL